MLSVGGGDAVSGPYETEQFGVLVHALNDVESVVFLPTQGDEHDFLIAFYFDAYMVQHADL